MARFLFLLIFVAFALARADGPSSAYIDKALSLELYKNKRWLTLLHFSGRKSEIEDKNFFYSKSKNDKSLPKYEMIETIKAFYQNQEEVIIPEDLQKRIIEKNKSYNKDSKLPEASLDKKDYHAICRFPARLEFLNEYLQFDNLPNVECNEYKEMLKHVNPKKATIVFPSAYINSPASSFGHTFILLQGDYENKLLSYAVNYAANADNRKENAFSFAIRGLLGGYSGAYSIMPYYEKIKEYRDTENRDIWEFSLNLTQEEVKRFFAHLWEVHNNQERYLFFTKNCAYNILWLIEAARAGVDLRRYFVYQVNPPETIFAMQRENLIKSQVYRPSKRTLINAYNAHLPMELVSKAKRIAKGKMDAKYILQDSDIDKGKQQKTLELSQELVEYNALKGKLDSKDYVDIAYNIAKARATLGNGEVIKISKPREMLDGNQGGRISVFNLFKNDKNCFGLEFRPAYHDITDSDVGYLKGAGIEFLKASIYIDDDKESFNKIQLQEAKILSIESYGMFNTIFHPVSFRFNTGFDRNFYVDSPNYYIRIGVGLSYTLSHYGYIYYMAEPVFFTYQGGNVALSNVFGLNIGDDHRLKLSLEYANRIYGRINSNIISATLNINLVRNLALFCNYQHYFFNQTYIDRYNISAGVFLYF